MTQTTADTHSIGRQGIAGFGFTGPQEQVLRSVFFPGEDGLRQGYAPLRQGDGAGRFEFLGPLAMVPSSMPVIWRGGDLLH